MINHLMTSHPAWVCGLKLVLKNVRVLWVQSHPAWVCGLKRCKQFFTRQVEGSHPAWVCGLKHGLIRPSTTRSQVTPCVGVWIETIPFLRINIIRPVTPCVGVWIETNWDQRYKLFLESHPAWVCGLKPFLCYKDTK